MTVIERTFAVDRTELFAVIVDPQTYPQWLVGTKKMHDVSPSWPEPGSSFEHAVGFGPLELTDRTTVRAVDAPRRLELFVRARPLLEAHVVFDLEPQGQATRLRMTETPAGPFKLLAPLVAPLIRARNSRSLDQLAAYLHARPPSPAAHP